MDALIINGHFISYVLFVCVKLIKNNIYIKFKMKTFVGGPHWFILVKKGPIFRI